ncbi:SigE family RNA polymerase sigma factor [Micromonospora sp. NPDC047670]|uniref:SigE family RNA polymerase sigma factor n=1 Tax=Micromonospora sp. NPDC047670 TaxID=3364252 RepID=UPI0037205270
MTQTDARPWVTPRPRTTPPPRGTERPTIEVRAAVVEDAGPGFDDVYRHHFQPLVVQLYAFVGDMGEAQDLVQEAFSRAWPRWHRIARYDDPVAWVRRVAWNAGVSRWRRLRTARLFHQRQRLEVVDGPGPDRVALATALRTLPAQQRRAVVLYYLAELTVGEIAEECAVAPGTVKSWLHRARTTLAASLSDKGTEHPDGSRLAAPPTRRTVD